TVGTPNKSATFPSTGTNTPPALTDRPRVTPDASPTRFGRYCCPKTTSELYGTKIKNPAKMIMIADNIRDSVIVSTKSTGTRETKLNPITLIYPRRSAILPPNKVPTDVATKKRLKSIFPDSLDCKITVIQKSGIKVFKLIKTIDLIINTTLKIEKGFH